VTDKTNLAVRDTARAGSWLRTLATISLLCATVAWAQSARADITGSIQQNFFNGFTINEGQYGTGHLQLQLVPGGVASDGAGTTTNRITGGLALDWTSTGTGPNDDPVPGERTLTTKTMTVNYETSFGEYRLPGEYTIAYSGNIIWDHTTSPSSGVDGTVIQPVSGSANVTVLNIAPTITGTILARERNTDAVINEGDSYHVQLQATDPGGHRLYFYLNGDFLDDTNASNGQVVGVGVYEYSGKLPGVYAQTFGVSDSIALTEVTRNLSVLNIAPTITQYIPDQGFDPTKAFNFATAATDPGTKVGGTISYMWDWQDDGVFDDFTGSNGTIPANYFANVHGEHHKVTFLVSDGYGGNVYHSFTLTVPEPATIVMAGVGLAGLLHLAARRRKSRLI